MIRAAEIQAGPARAQDSHERKVGNESVGLQETFQLIFID
jgi:hypothetical protein